jgi:hypothetical protein
MTKCGATAYRYGTEYENLFVLLSYIEVFVVSPYYIAWIMNCVETEVLLGGAAAIKACGG